MAAVHKAVVADFAGRGLAVDEGERIVVACMHEIQIARNTKLLAHISSCSQEGIQVSERSEPHLSRQESVVFSREGGDGERGSRRSGTRRNEDIIVVTDSEAQLPYIIKRIAREIDLPALAVG